MASNRLSDAATQCLRIFSFLVTEFGFRAPTMSSDSTSFTVRFQTDQTGVQVSYAIRGGLIVWLCQLDNGAWPVRPGRIPRESEIYWFDLYDVPAGVQGQPPDVAGSIYAIPDQRMLSALH